MPYGKNTTSNTSNGIAAGYQSDCLACTMGYYCLNATIKPYPCGKGKYSKSGQSICPSCPNGRYCDVEATGFDEMEANKTCPAGKYCDGGLKDVSEAKNCTEAHYCPQGIVHDYPYCCIFCNRSKFQTVYVLLTLLTWIIYCIELNFQDFTFDGVTC